MLAAPVALDLSALSVRDPDGAGWPAVSAMRIPGGFVSEHLAIVPTNGDRRVPHVAPSMGTPEDVACAHAVIRLEAKGDRAWWRCDACQTPFAPAILAPRPIDVEPALEYLSVRQLAERIPYTEGAIRNLMSRGVLRLGIHYTKPHARPIFEWAAIVEWLKVRGA